MEIKRKGDKFEVKGSNPNDVADAVHYRSDYESYMDNLGVNKLKGDSLFDIQQACRQAHMRGYR
jgi:hypothetical protein